MDISAMGESSASIGKPPWAVPGGEVGLPAKPYVHLQWQLIKTR